MDTTTAPSQTRVVDEMGWARPHPALRGHAAAYTAYRQRGVAPALHRGLPSPYLTLIFTFDVPLDIAAHPDPAQRPGSYRSLLGGLHTRPALITHDGNQSGVQVALSPLGARQLLGLPAGQLAGIDVAAGDVLGRLADEICDRLDAARTWTERFHAVDSVLRRQLAHEAPMPPPEVCRAWHLVLASGGRASVADLAADVGWSTRHLAGRFREETGLSPKAALRVTRFDRVRRRLARPAQQPLSLARAAADGGYYDQAHLAHEFRELAGCPPSEWLATEIANLQGEVAPPGAPWSDER